MEVQKLSGLITQIKTNSYSIDFKKLQSTLMSSNASNGKIISKTLIAQFVIIEYQGLSYDCIVSFMQSIIIILKTQRSNHLKER